MFYIEECFSVPKIAPPEARKKILVKCMDTYFSVPKIASPEARKMFVILLYCDKKQNDNFSSGGRGGCVPTISSWVEPPVEKET